jgi:hypothetical protein
VAILRICCNVIHWFKRETREQDKTYEGIKSRTKGIKDEDVKKVFLNI